MRKRQITIYIISVLLIALTSSCYEEESIDEGEGLSDWSASTHGSNTTPSYDEVFSSSEVHRMDIVIDPDYWDIMVDNLEDILGTSSSFAKPPGGDVGGGATIDSDISETPSYVPCSIFWNDIEWYYVGVRFKGNSSLSTAYNSKTYKLPLRLKFDHFATEYPQITGQTFYGFSELSLSSNFLDMSLMREKIAADLFREFGVPAPHTSYCRIYVDHGDGPVYFGLYTIVEIISDTMLAEQFGSENGNCYKPEGTGASFDEGTFSEDDFEKKTNVTNGDWSDIENLFDVLHDDSRTNNPDQWRENLENIFDVNHFLRWLAANTTIQNWDTYGIMTHNYYLYHDPSDDLIKWIPWDNNEAFQDGKQGGSLSINLSEVDSSWPLINYIIGQTEYENIYKNYLSEFITTVFEPSKMQSTYEEQSNLIQQYVTGTDGEIDGYTFLSSDLDFNSAVSELKSHVTTRKTVVNGYVN